MNFIFISLQFPRHYWNFCDRLRRNGVDVLGIGDTPFDDLRETLKDYDAVLRRWRSDGL